MRRKGYQAGIAETPWGEGGGPPEGLKRATNGGPKTVVNRYFCENITNWNGIWSNWVQKDIQNIQFFWKVRAQKEKDKTALEL